jgi:hypothetical protein
MNGADGKTDVRKKVTLKWFINSCCDYECSNCTPHAGDTPHLDMGISECLEALNSFAEFSTDRAATLTFYPRQAPFVEPFLTVLRTACELKTKGALKSIRSANRGDLPDDKALLFKEHGVDTCQLTIDGPEPVQNTLRRPDSYRDTLHAFRTLQSLGIHVSPLVIIVQYNAPHIRATLRLLLDEGFDDITLQVGIRPNSDAYPMLPNSGNPSKTDTNPWNRSLNAAEYRSFLLDVLGFLDELPSDRAAFRTKTILAHPLYARLFHEQGRGSEYRGIREGASVSEGNNHELLLLLRPYGELLCHENLPPLGSFPGLSFKELFHSSPLLQLLDNPGARHGYGMAAQKEWSRCRDCPVAEFCPPVPSGGSGNRLYLYPDDHCWVC